MKRFKLNILAITTIVLLLAGCKKDKSGSEILAEGRVTFNLPATTEVVTQSVDVKQVTLMSLEMKAEMQGEASADVHYVTFATDTSKITEYRQKYGSNALLLPTKSYLYYKSTVAIPAGAKVSDPAVLNIGFQTSLRGLSTYVLPLVITKVDGQLQDPKTRKVIYYVFNTGAALYVDHTGFTLTATASSTNGTNAASRVVDGNNLGTYWLSNITQDLPQWVSIDFGREITFSGLDYFFPTAAVYATMGGNTTSVKIETSSNGTTWIDKGTYPVEVRNTERKQTLNMPALTTARYLRFNVLSAAPYVSGSSTYSVCFVGEIVMRN